MTYRQILQAIVTSRFADTSAALAAIDEAFEADRISNLERGRLSQAVRTYL